MSEKTPDREPTNPKLLDVYKHAKTDFPGPYGKWLRIIYGFMIAHECSIFEAERLALGNPHRRKWVERAINAGNPCRKYALAHIRQNGADALVVREGQTFNFKIPPPQQQATANP